MLSNNYLKYLFITLLLAQISCRLERRILIPPILQDENIEKKIVCYRPIRKSGPAMFIELIKNPIESDTNKANIISSETSVVEKDEKISGDYSKGTVQDLKNNESISKIIVHNYGHGGGGWSLAPGAAKYIVNMLNSKMKELKLAKNEKITVVGAGIIGLFTIYELLKLGYNNIELIAENFTDLPSNHAGGLWSPFHIGDISNKKTLIKHIGINSYNFYLNIINGNNSQFLNCAKVMPAYFLKPNKDLELFVGSVLKPAKKVLVDFQTGKTMNLYVYDNTMIINTPLLMTKLAEFAFDNNVKKIKKKINSFEEIKSKVIVNCTGFGAKKLCNDNELISVQGHLLVLKGQNPKLLNYLLTVPFEEDIVNGYRVKRLHYMIPRHDPGAPNDRIGVIGGTLILGVENGDQNRSEFKKIISRAKKFYGIKY